MIPSCIQESAVGVCGSDRYMNHRRRHLAAGLVIALRHRHGDVFMWHGHKTGHLCTRFVGPDQALNNRREVCTRIGKDILDTVG